MPKKPFENVTEDDPFSGRCEMKSSTRNRLTKAIKYAVIESIKEEEIPLDQNLTQSSDSKATDRTFLKKGLDYEMEVELTGGSTFPEVLKSKYGLDKKLKQIKKKRSSNVYQNINNDDDDTPNDPKSPNTPDDLVFIMSNIDKILRTDGKVGDHDDQDYDKEKDSIVSMEKCLKQIKRNKKAINNLVSFILKESKMLKRIADQNTYLISKLQESENFKFLSRNESPTRHCSDELPSPSVDKKPSKTSLRKNSNPQLNDDKILQKFEISESSPIKDHRSAFHKKIKYLQRKLEQIHFKTVDRMEKVDTISRQFEKVKKDFAMIIEKSKRQSMKLDDFLKKTQPTSRHSI